MKDKSAPYVDPDGNRVRYAWGYVVRGLGGTPFFSPAHQLRGIDGNIGYLRLVGSRSATETPAPKAMS